MDVIKMAEQMIKASTVQKMFHCTLILGCSLFRNTRDVFELTKQGHLQQMIGTLYTEKSGP